MRKKTWRLGQMEQKQHFSLSNIAPQKLVQTLLTATEQRLISGIVKAGYEAEKKYVSTNAPEWIQIDRAQKLYPELKNMAVEFALRRACDHGVIPFTYKIGTVEQNKNKFLELVSTGDKKVILTVNQTPTDKHASRNAKFRSNLFDQCESKLILFDDEERSTGAIYMELNHGYQTEIPAFTVLGKPNADGKWEARLSLQNNIQLLSKGEEADIQTTAKQMSEFGPDEFNQYKEFKTKG